MTLAAIALGAAGCAVLLLGDVWRLARRGRVAPAASALGYAAFCGALALQVTRVPPAGPPLARAAAGVAAGAFGLLLVYSVLVEIPLRGHRRAAGAALYTGGTYALCRHPGLLWFLLLELCLNCVWQEPSFLVASVGLVSADFALVAIEDRYLFPPTFAGYDEYKSRVPFLLPRFRAH